MRIFVDFEGALYVKNSMSTLREGDITTAILDGQEDGVTYYKLHGAINGALVGLLSDAMQDKDNLVTLVINGVEDADSADDIGVIIREYLVEEASSLADCPIIYVRNFDMIDCLLSDELDKYCCSEGDAVYIRRDSNEPKTTDKIAGRTVLEAMMFGLNVNVDGTDGMDELESIFGDADEAPDYKAPSTEADEVEHELDELEELFNLR